MFGGSLFPGSREEKFVSVTKRGVADVTEVFFDVRGSCDVTERIKIFVTSLRFL